MILEGVYKKFHFCIFDRASYFFFVDVMFGGGDQNDYKITITITIDYSITEVGVGGISGAPIVIT